MGKPYNTMHYARDNTSNYLFRFHNFQKVNEAYNGSLITRGLQDNGMNIIYLLHTTGFDITQDDDKKEAETVGEKILCSIFYLEN